jgi:hypothetical protein
MKVEIGIEKKTQLEVLKNKFLLLDDNIIVIRDFKIQEEICRKQFIGTTYGKPFIKLFVISMTIEGYNQEGKFLGVHNEHTCWRLLTFFNLYYFRNQWTNLCDALKTFGYEIRKIETLKTEDNDKEISDRKVAI